MENEEAKKPDIRVPVEYTESHDYKVPDQFKPLVLAYRKEGIHHYQMTIGDQENLRSISEYPTGKGLRCTYCSKTLGDHPVVLRPTFYHYSKKFYVFSSGNNIVLQDMQNFTL